MIATTLSPDDFVYLLETDRETWIAIRGVDEAGRSTQFRLAFTTLERARAFAGRHRELPARRIREVRLGDMTAAGEPPLALDVDPAFEESSGSRGPLI